MENEGVQPESHGIPQESSRERNLSIITSYIQRQKSLLSRIRQDVDKLEVLKHDVELDCEEAFSKIILGSANTCDKGSPEVVQAPVFEKLEVLVKDAGVQETDIIGSLDWDVLKNEDSSRLMTMQKSIPSDYLMPPPTPVTPSVDQSKPTLSSFVFGPRMLHSPSSKASSLQRRMRELRQQLVSPALEQAQQFFASLPPDSDEGDSDDDPRKNGKKMRGREGGTGARAAANRRRVEAATIAATSRPRGFGGRFLRTKDARSSQQGVNSPLTPSADGLDGSFWADTGRTKRNRRPSTRYGSPAPTIASVVSGRSTTAKVSRSQASRHPESPVSTSPAPCAASEGSTRVRLTIRIPTLASLQKRKNKSADTDGHGPSGSTSVSTSNTPSESIRSTSVGTSAFSAGQRNNIGPRINETGSCFSHRAFSSTSSLGQEFEQLKQEERDAQMEVDMWDAEPTANGHRSQSSSLFRYDPGDAPRRKRSLRSRESSELFERDMPLSATSSGHNPSSLPPPTATSVADSVSLSVASEARSSGHEDAASTSQSTVKKWTDEEQSCLNELLQQYPDGTKNRWAAISRAMNGARNPRQIAARVQKLFNRMTNRSPNLVDDEPS